MTGTRGQAIAPLRAAGLSSTVLPLWPPSDEGDCSGEASSTAGEPAPAPAPSSTGAFLPGLSTDRAPCTQTRRGSGANSATCK
jgi:hypothetical protein